ncbi:MAG TPA: hypothetical protein VGF69_00605 [Thermoanaerobaculia bacterium]|jgi:hypothetical protein
MRKLCALALALLAAAACETAPPRDSHVIAAETLTNDCAKSRLADWKVQATAVGRNCDVLQIQTANVMEPSMVEAVHYGYGYYDLYEGGVQQFHRERGFRAVFYRDREGNVWSYGIEKVEIANLVPCH